MELKEGMYVTTTDRKQIGRIIGFCECEMCKERGYCEPVIDNPEMFITISDKERKFHGYKFYDDLFSLVKVGDYVNGHKVLEVNQFSVEVESNAIENETWEEIENYEIKSIVTKEEFSSMEYKVNE